MELKSWRLKCPEKGIDIEAETPFCNYTALMKAGIIPDPFVGKNEETARWVAECDWVCESKFRADNTHKFLRFDGLDTVATVYLDGEKAAETKNVYRTYRIPVTEGEHTVRIEVRSPIVYIGELAKRWRPIKNFQGITGYGLVRKPGYHFGWDWGPILPPSGLFAAVLETHLPLDVRVYGDYDGNLGTVSWRSEEESEAVLCDPNGREIARQMGKEGIFEVADPELWFPNGMSERTAQPLYTLTITAGERTAVKRVGIRRIRLNRDVLPDGGRDFCFEVNGKRVFACGANWIPPDSFPDRQTREDYFAHAELMREANFNCLRVWGGGYWLNEDMLDALDEKGILLWHDFPYACTLYPFNHKSFTADAIEEVKENVKRIEGRACLALWCGNNEIEQMGMGWFYRAFLRRANYHFFRKTLPAVLKEIDVQTFYWPSSPCSDDSGKQPNYDHYGDCHIWNVWHGLMPFDYFKRRDTRFCSEFGFESTPSLSAVRRMFGGEVSTDIDVMDPILQHHQKCPAGNDKILYYMLSEYRAPADFNHFLYLSQRIQGDNIRIATEHWRARTPKCNGSLFWQWDDCWCTLSWSAVDDKRKPKGLWYEAKRFFRPVSATLEVEEGKAKAIAYNHSGMPFAGNYRLALLGYDGTVYAECTAPIELGGYDVRSLAQLDLPADPATCSARYISFTLDNAAGETVWAFTSPVGKERDAALPKDPKLQIVVDGKVVTVKAASYARKLMLDVPTDDSGRFSDNFFDVEPGRTYRVLYTGDAEKLKTDLVAVHFALLTPKYTLEEEEEIRMRIERLPVHVANRIAYKMNG